MKKIFLTIISAAFLFSCANTIPGFEKSKIPPKDDLTSLRKHLAYKKWVFLPLSETETLISYHEWGNRPTFKPELKYLIKEYCEHQGGKLPPSGFECKGGNDPFMFRTFDGYRKYFSSTKSTYFLLFTIVKATKPDVDIDYGFYSLEFMKKAKKQSLEEFIKENSGFVKPFTEMEKKEDQYIFEVSTNNPSVLSQLDGRDLGGFWSLVQFCKAHNGEVLKENPKTEKFEPFKVWFVNLIFYSDGRTFYISPLSGKPTFYLNGRYACNSKDEPFYFDMKGRFASKSLGGFARYKVFLRKGVPKDFEISEELSLFKNTTAKNKHLILRDLLALSASENKAIIERREGPRIFKSIYVYSKKGCDYVAVIDQIKEEKSPNIMNYLICKGKIAYKEPTHLIEPTPDFIKKVVPEIVKRAKYRGFAEYKDNYGYKVIAKAPRSQDVCNVEVFVYHKRELINYRVVDTCE